MPFWKIHKNGRSNESAPRNGRSNETVPRNSSSNETALRVSLSNEIPPRISILNGTAVRNGMSNGTAPRNSLSNETAHRNSLSNGTAVRNGVPNRNSASVAESRQINLATVKKSRDQTESPDDLVAMASPDLDILPSDKTEAEEGTSYQLSLECSKHPGHKEFTPINNLNISNLPHPYQTQEWVKFIQLKGVDTVLIEVEYTSAERPDDLGFVAFRGTNNKRTGSGTAFIMNMDKTEDCYCSEISGAHKISGCFLVMTVAHVVFDNDEAKNTVVTFFYDDERDRSTVVKARGGKVSHIDVQRNRSLIECRTHDLTLYQRLLNTQQERASLIKNSLANKVNNDISMIVLISHPHGLSKQVSIGKLLNIIEEGEVKTTKNGVELIGCVMTYDTPTCPGTGGGSINLIGHGEVCSAFAPHCASKSNGINISGLGWTKYVKSMQLRVSY